MQQSEIKIIIAGSGGQGILFLGKLLSYCAMLNNKNTTWFPSYGAEMRGGTANCTVIISDTLIGSPIVKIADVLIALNLQSFNKFSNRVCKDGSIFYDSSITSVDILHDSIKKIPIDCSLKNQKNKFTNMLFAGAVINYCQICSLEMSLKAINELSNKQSKEIVNHNIEMLKKGFEIIENSKTKNL